MSENTPIQTQRFYQCDCHICYNNIIYHLIFEEILSNEYPVFSTYMYNNLPSDFYLASKHNVHILFCLAYSLFMFPRLILLGQLMTVKASSFSVHLSILIILEGGITFSLFETSEERY